MAGYRWTAGPIRALRKHLRLSQAAFGRELGIRQATVSEWETGLYQPRGASARLLSLVAERAGFEYEVGRSARGQTTGGGTRARSRRGAAARTIANPDATTSAETSPPRGGKAQPAGSAPPGVALPLESEP
jgi:transcriptional regulator with XRE-family HTH domain